jgi:hypothetical protein
MDIDGPEHSLPDPPDATEELLRAIVRRAERTAQRRRAVGGLALSVVVLMGALTAVAAHRAHQFDALTDAVTLDPDATTTTEPPAPPAERRATRTTPHGTTIALTITDRSDATGPCASKDLGVEATVAPAHQESFGIGAVLRGSVGSSKLAILDVSSGPTLGVTLVVVRVGDAIDHVRLTVGEATDTAPPLLDDVAVLAVPALPAVGGITLEGLDASDTSVVRMDVIGTPTAPPGDGGATCTTEPTLLPDSGEGPADRVAAEREVLDAFTYIYNTKPNPDPDHTISLIEDGETIRAVLDELRDRYPDQAKHLVTTVEDVTFQGPTHASVAYDISTTNYRSGRRIGHAVLQDGRWKVTRETWCETVRPGGVTCPPA